MSCVNRVADPDSNSSACGIFGAGFGSGSALQSDFRSFRGSKQSRGRSHLRPGGFKWSLGGSIDQCSKIPITLMRSRLK